MPASARPWQRRAATVSGPLARSAGRRLCDQRARRHPIEAVLDRATDGAEPRQILTGQLGAARQLEVHRIDLLVIGQHLVVQVRPCCTAGWSDISGPPTLTS